MESITKSGFEFSVLYGIAELWAMSDANLFATAKVYSAVMKDPSQDIYNSLRDECALQVPKRFELLCKAILKGAPDGLSNLTIEELLKKLGG